MATVRFALVGVCYISEEHARLSGPPHHRGIGRRDMGKEVHGGKMDHGEGWGGCGDTFSYKYSLIARKSL